MTSEVLTWEAFEDRQEPGQWRVEAIDFGGDGECYVTIFAGPQAAKRAMAYAESMNEPTEEEREAIIERMAEVMWRSDGWGTVSTWASAIDVDPTLVAKYRRLARAAYEAEHGR